MLRRLVSKLLGSRGHSRTTTTPPHGTPTRGGSPKAAAARKAVKEVSKAVRK
jgi:hypothetical protein